MKRSLFFAFIFMLSACSNDPKSGQESASAVASTPAAPASPVSTPDGQPARLDATLTLVAAPNTIKKGGEACIDITCAGFVDLVSMQYTMLWDKSILAFKEVKGFGLPYLSPNSFGAHRSAEGELTFVWIDNSLKGVTKPDGSILFQVCFSAVGNTGQASAFRFSDQPTAIEAVHKDVKLVNFQGVEGVIKVQ